MLAAAGMAAAALGDPLRAQDARTLTTSATVPTELAAALISAGGIGGADQPRIVVASLPEWVTPRVWIPMGARVVGAALNGTTVVAVVNVPALADTAMPEIKRELRTRGWSAPPPQPVPNFGGFRPTVNAVPDVQLRSAVMCGAGVQAMTVTMQRGEARSTNLVYRIYDAIGYTQCKPVQLPPQQYRSPWPTLYNPVASTDGRMPGVCASGISGGGAVTSTMLKTALTGDSVLTHYAKQLADSGWKSIGERGFSIARTWTRPDSAGVVQELTLTVTTLAKEEGCRDVQMTVRALPKP